MWHSRRSVAWRPSRGDAPDGADRRHRQRPTDLGPPPRRPARSLRRRRPRIASVWPSFGLGSLYSEFHTVVLSFSNQPDWIDEHRRECVPVSRYTAAPGGSSVLRWVRIYVA